MLARNWLFKRSSSRSRALASSNITCSFFQLDARASTSRTAARARSTGAEFLRIAGVLKCHGESDQATVFITRTSLSSSIYLRALDIQHTQSGVSPASTGTTSSERVKIRSGTVGVARFEPDVHCQQMLRLLRTSQPFPAKF